MGQRGWNCNSVFAMDGNTRKSSRKLNRRRFLRCAFCSAPFVAAADAFALEPEWIKLRTIRLASGKSVHRFVQFTDLHHKGDRAYLEKVVRIINGLSPDFVCFTGDMVEDAAFLPEALQLMGQIKAPLFGIPGNHDYWSKIDFRVVAKSFAATGGQWLLDENAVVGDGRINLIGATCTNAPNFQPQPGMKNILLIHYPYWVEQLVGMKFDLILAGHSHGGQVRLPFIGAIMVPGGVGKYDLGMFQTPSGPLYVNAGIGYFHLNVRFNCRPEITVFELFDPS